MGIKIKIQNKIKIKILIINNFYQINKKIN